MTNIPDLQSYCDQGFTCFDSCPSECPLLDKTMLPSKEAMGRISDYLQGKPLSQLPTKTLWRKFDAFTHMAQSEYLSKEDREAAQSLADEVTHAQADRLRKRNALNSQAASRWKGIEL